MGTETPVIVRTVHEFLSTYDVTDQHLCINEKGNPIEEVFKELEKKLKEDYGFLIHGVEYFDVSAVSDGRYAPFPYADRLCIFYVKGGSEGYYVHVETKDKHGKSTCQFLAKTLNEGLAGITWAEQMVCALSRIMEP